VERDKVRLEATRMSAETFWVDGIPATFATAKEAPWKLALKNALPTGTGRQAAGLRLEFLLPSLSPSGQPLDVDNLCEPVFSVFINKLGWFGGKRPNLMWWSATKACGDPSGVRLTVEPGPAPDMDTEFGQALFNAAYRGELPSSATDERVPAWLRSLGPFAVPRDSARLALRLRFGAARVNIGNIAAGKVKSLIDCLYPILGGSPGDPEDSRIDVLQVEKGVEDLEADTVAVTAWEQRR